MNLNLLNALLILGWILIFPILIFLLYIYMGFTSWVTTDPFDWIIDGSVTISNKQ